MRRKKLPRYCRSTEYFGTKAFGSAADVALHSMDKWLVVSVADSQKKRRVVYRGEQTLDSYNHLHTLATELAQSFASVSTPYAYAQKPDDSSRTIFKRNRPVYLVTGRIDASTLDSPY